MRMLGCFRLARISPAKLDNCNRKPLDDKTNLRRHVHSAAVPTVNDIRRASLTPDIRLSFRETFGVLGWIFILVVVVSILWTLWLITLTIAPNATANFLTNTAEFDDGNFWLIVDTESTFLTVSVVSLAGLVLVYADVLLTMTIWRNSFRQASPFNVLVAAMCPTTRLRTDFEHKVLRFWSELTAFNGRRRKFWNALLKLPDLAIEIAALYRLLEDGIPTILCYSFACLIAANSLSCALFILRPGKHSAFSEMFVDSFFDMIFAVGWPILWLTYSVKHFQFNRAQALLYLKLYPTGWFERKARLMADAPSTTLFQISFDSLRMKSGADLCLRMAMNLSFCYRLRRVVEYTIRRRRLVLSRAGKPSLTKVVQQMSLPRSGAMFFVAVSIGVIVFMHMSIAASGHACLAFPQCVVYAFRWKNHVVCPCRALIDVDRAPRTYEEWTHPPNATDLVADMAASGDLRILQIINRQLPAWPEQLQKCTDLRRITLMYTNVQVVPEWTAKFSRLELLSIEGRPMDTNLVSLPENLFDNMPKLTFLYFAVHQNLRRLPPMTGLTNLKAFTLAVMLSLEELPPLDTLVKLQLVQVYGAVRTQRIPNLSPDVGAVELIVVASQACCNGYIVCNPSDLLCAAHRTCLDKSDPGNRPNESTQRIFDLVTSKTCIATPELTTTDFFVTPTQQDVDSCGGELYGECRKLNVTGMCYSERMQVVACQTMSLRMIVRKQEIQHGIGDPCDPVREKWLGCGL